MNLAARLMSHHAKVKSGHSEQQQHRPLLLTDHRTMEAAGDTNIAFRSFGRVQFKGKSEEMAVYSMDEAGASSSMWRRVRRSLIGREHEMDLLRTQLHRGGQCVVIEAPAGVGKSILVSEFLAELREQKRVSVFCSRQNRGLPYGVFAALLGQLFGWDGEETSQDRESAITKLLAGALTAGEVSAREMEEVETVLSSLNGCLSVNFAEKGLHLSVAMRHTLMQQLLLVLLRVVLVQRDRAVLCIEDCHWIDQSSLLALEAVVCSSPALLDRIGTLILTARPHSDPNFDRVKERCVRVELRGLSAGNVAQIARESAGASTALSEGCGARVGAVGWQPAAGCGVGAGHSRRNHGRARTGTARHQASHKRVRIRREGMLLVTVQGLSVMTDCDGSYRPDALCARTACAEGCQRTGHAILRRYVASAAAAGSLCVTNRLCTGCADGGSLRLCVEGLAWVPIRTRDGA